MVTRDHLLDLDKKRKTIEEEIHTLTQYLEQPGMPGLDGKLTDNEGFPLAGLDLFEIRKTRNRIIMIQNDYKALMSVIEQKMQSYFEQANKEKKTIVQEKKNISTTDDPILISPVEENKLLDKNKIFLPFAFVGAVFENSPADEAGLKLNDGIVKFDSVESGKYSDPLIKISELVRLKKDTAIDVEVIRKSADEQKLEFKQLKLIPHVWNGQGLLGCKLTLENKK